MIVCGVAGVMVLEQQDGGEWTMVGEQSLEGLTPNALLTSPSSSPLWLALSCKHSEHTLTNNYYNCVVTIYKFFSLVTRKHVS